MKKQSISLITVILLSFIFPSISWVSANNFPFNKSILVEKSSAVIANSISNTELFVQHSASIYKQAKLAESGLDQNLFRKALVGYYNLKKTQSLSTEKALLTIIDFSKKSSQKRLWIINLKQSKLLFNTLVAHGQGSGLDLATSFSNKANSHQSSLGFYLTSETYFGKHGLSMRLEGMDKGFNSNARERAVVVHGASYVSQDFVNKTGRLGRSFGCPALPQDLSKTIIDTIKGQTCLFISGPADNYKSNYLDQEMAISNFIASAD
jgi:hypothetical protein